MPAPAAMLACAVIGIADGDTLTARCDVREGKVNVTVRVTGIHAAASRARATYEQVRVHSMALSRKSQA